jgi:hypothetical protein
MAVKCVSAARPDCATSAWGILCEWLDGRSYARSLSLLDNLMLRERLGQSLTEYYFASHATKEGNTSANSSGRSPTPPSPELPPCGRTIEAPSLTPKTHW